MGLIPAIAEMEYGCCKNVSAYLLETYLFIAHLLAIKLAIFYREPNRVHHKGHLMGVIIVTGCSGRIGTKVCRRFSENGFKVVGFDLRVPGPEAGHIDFIKVDLTSDASVREGFDYFRKHYGDRISSIIHLAAYSTPNAEHPELYDKITVQGTGRILENAKNFQTEQFLFTSSILVYKSTSPGVKITENSTINAKWSYPKSKVKTENLIHKLHGHIPTVIMRIAGCYDNQCRSVPIANEIQRIYEHQFTSWVFPGDISHGTSFLHLDDLTDAIWLAVQKRAELPEETTLIIGESRTMSYDALQREISKLIDGKELRTVRVPKWFAKAGAWVENHLPFMGKTSMEPWMIDVADDHYELDISRARMLLGWTPKYFVGSALPIMIEFLKRDPRAFYKINNLKCSETCKENAHV